VRVVLYSRPGCHLCDAARAVLEAERGRTPFELQEVDVQGDAALERVYGVRIPVVEIDGEERFEFEVDPGELSRVLREAVRTAD
jgi:glutaredoxin